MKPRGRKEYRESVADAIGRSYATLGISPLIGIFRSAMADFRIAFNLPPKEKSEQRPAQGKSDQLPACETKWSGPPTGRDECGESAADAIGRSVSTLGISPLIGIFRSAMADFRIAFNLPPKKKGK